MKRALFAILAGMMLIGCKSDKRPNLDIYAQLTLNGSTTTPAALQTKTPPEPPYSIQTITKYASNMSFTRDYPETPYASRGFVRRDIEAGKLQVGQMDDVVALDKNGDYILGWIVTSNMHDVVLRACYKGNEYGWPQEDWADPEQERFSGKYDTIGYVPNEVIKRAEVAIHAAFDAGDYDECMRLFEEAYVFIPTTGAEWRALKAAGIE